jgi:hypothetical protein
MRSRWRFTPVVGILVAALGCGGGDEATSDRVDGGPSLVDDVSGEGDANDGGDAAVVDGTIGEATNGDVTTADVAAGDTTDATNGNGDDAGLGSGSIGGEAPSCDRLFTIDEIAAWFEEPAELTEEWQPSLGQLVCTWETIEDPDDLDDLAFQLIIAQVFTGDPIPAANFIDPEIYDDPVMLDGIGDLAFYGDTLGTDFNFLDEPWAGSFSYSDVDMGDVDAEKHHTFDEVEAMFREFHARVTR